MVPAVVARPLRSVAVTLADTAVTEPGMLELTPTQEPLPESVRVTVRVEVTIDPVRVSVAMTLLIADSSVTGTWIDALEQVAEEKRTAMEPTCGGRPTAPFNDSVAAGAPVAVTCAATAGNGPSGNVAVLAYVEAVARANVTVTFTLAPEANVPEDGLNVKNAGRADAAFQPSAVAFLLVRRTFIVVDVVPKSRDEVLRTNAVNDGGRVVVLVAGVVVGVFVGGTTPPAVDVVVIAFDTTVVDERGGVVGVGAMDDGAADVVGDPVSIVVSIVVSGPESDVLSGAVSEGSAPPEMVVTGVPVAVMPSSDDDPTSVAPTNAPVATSTTAPVDHHSVRRVKRAARGNPSLVRQRMRAALPVPVLVPLGIAMLDVAARTLARKPSGAANTGAAPNSASGATLPLVSSQVSHDSMCRATRLRMRTLKRPSQSRSISSKASHSLRPALATT